MLSPISLAIEMIELSQAVCLLRQSSVEGSKIHTWDRSISVKAYLPSCDRDIAVLQMMTASGFLLADTRIYCRLGKKKNRAREYLEKISWNASCSACREASKLSFHPGRLNVCGDFFRRNCNYTLSHSSMLFSGWLICGGLPHWR